MTIEEVEKWFGNLNKACIALKIDRTNANHWRKKKYIPLVQQVFLETITKGKLVRDKENPRKNPNLTCTKKPKNTKKERE